MKESVVTSSAIACAAVGFVLGSAIFAPQHLSPAAYAIQWLLVTACFSAAFIFALISEYALGKFYGTSMPPLVWMIIIILALIGVAEAYKALRKPDAHPIGKIIITLFHGIFYGLFLGYML
jgi:hypothetical protein